jgi:hypothetical protein
MTPGPAAYFCNDPARRQLLRQRVRPRQPCGKDGGRTVRFGRNLGAGDEDARLYNFVEVRSTKNVKLTTTVWERLLASFGIESAPVHPAMRRASFRNKRGWC